MAKRRGRSGGLPIQSLLLLGGALLLAGLGGFLLWQSLGTPDENESFGAPEGTVGVPIAATDLPAYTEIRLEHLLDPRSGQLAVVYLPEESILESTIVDARDLLGRVLARSKTASRVFSEADLLPVGTRPGLVAGIPANKRALRIDASKVNGIVGLQQGDRFDLVATFPASAQAGVESIYGGRPGGGNTRRARAHIVADGATVVSALENRALPGNAGRSGAVVQEMVIALSPEEIPVVTEALELAKRIDCIPRSGLPGAESASAANDAGAPARRSPYEEPVVDMISGNQRSLRLIPSQRTSPVGTEPRGNGG